MTRIVVLLLALTACTVSPDRARYRYAWTPCHESGTYAEVIPAHVQFGRRFIWPYLSVVYFDEYSYRDEIDAAKAKQYRNELTCYSADERLLVEKAIEAKDWGDARRLIRLTKHEQGERK